MSMQLQFAALDEDDPVAGLGLGCLLEPKNGVPHTWSCVGGLEQLLTKHMLHDSNQVM